MDLQSTVSGGTANSYYTVGAGYHRETTVMPGNFDDQKASLHFQLNSTSANQLFHLRLVGNYMLDLNRLPTNADGTDLTQTALQLAPDAPPLYNPDGSINWAPDPAGNSTWNGKNPMAKLLNSYQNQTSNLVNNVLLSYELAPGLSMKSSFGYTDLQTTEKLKFPLFSTAPELRQSTPRAGEYGNSSIRSWIIEPQVSYSTSMAKGRLETLAGSTIEQTTDNPDEIITLKTFHARIVNDPIGLRKEKDACEPLPSIRKVVHFDLQVNYQQIKHDVREIVDVVMGIITSDSAKEHLIVKK